MRWSYGGLGDTEPHVPVQANDASAGGRGSPCSMHDSTIFRANPCAILAVSANVLSCATSPGTSRARCHVPPFVKRLYMQMDRRFTHIAASSVHSKPAYTSQFHCKVSHATATDSARVRTPRTRSQAQSSEVISYRIHTLFPLSARQTCGPVV